MTAPITERTQSLIDYANDRRDTDYTNLTNIIENELDVDEQPPVEHIPSATLVEKAQSLIDYANGFFETDYDNLTDIILHDLKGQRTYSIEEKEPYLFRKSGGSAQIGERERDKIVGGTVAWNQLFPAFLGDTYASGTFNAGTSFTEGHKIFFSFSGSLIDSSGNKPTIRLYYYPVGDSQTNTIILRDFGSTIISCPITMVANGQYNQEGGAWLYYSNGSNVNAEGRYVNFIDLTQMFGSEIADYIYSLEQATAGAGVTFFRSMFPKPYYAYDAGSLVSVAGLKSHDTVGFNLFDKSTITDSAWLSTTTGLVESATSAYCVSDYIRVMKDVPIYIPATASVRRWFYDLNKTPKEYLNSSVAKIYTPTKDGYIRVTIKEDFADINTFCININSQRSGTYEPYNGHSYPLDSSLTLRGIPKLDSSNRLYYDGDTYESDGTVTRKYGIVDLGSLTWTYNAPTESKPLQQFRGQLSNVTSSTSITCIASNGYLSSISPVTGRNIDKTVCTLKSGNDGVFICDSAYSDATTFTSAMSGVYLVYELAESTTETADPFTNPQIVDPSGTEEYVCETVADVIVPVGHDTMYSTE